MRNLGPASARWLEVVGITSRSDLERVGAAGAFQRVRDAGFRPSLNLLYALQAALLDAHWTDLPAELKAQLRRAVEASSSTTEEG
ncbi:MAG: TfoX/Sxy family DNA transformation protein [Acidobacteriota bacterium]